MSERRHPTVFPGFREMAERRHSVSGQLMTLRRELGIDRWLVFGGSWGSTLALLYAETYPMSCRALVLRGVFLARQAEIEHSEENEQEDR